MADQFINVERLLVPDISGKEVTGSTPVFSTSPTEKWDFFMAYHVYIIYSAESDRYYVGHTEDINRRIYQHNTGLSTYTSKASDWELKYMETFECRTDARSRERSIKGKKAANTLNG